MSGVFDPTVQECVVPGFVRNDDAFVSRVG